MIARALGLGLCGLVLACHAAQVKAQAAVPLPAVASGPARGENLSPLLQMVQQAIDRSAAIREAQANLRAAEQDVQQARGALWPRLEFNGNSASVTGSSSANTANNRLLATMSYNLYDSGRTRNQIEARQQQVMAFRDKLRMAREGTGFDTVNAYLQVLKYQRLIKVYERHIAELLGLQERLGEIVAVLSGRRSELTQAQTRLAQARDSLSSLQARLREARLALMRQTGTSQDTLPDILPSLPVTDPAQLVEEAREQHPVIRGARYEAAAARAQVEEAQAAQKPQVDLQLTKQAGRDANGFGSPMQLYVVSKWLAFDGYGNRANVQALLERARAASDRADHLLDEVQFNVRTAWADYLTQTQRTQDLPKLLVGTDQVRKDTYDLWRELGRRSLLDVLTAETEHVTTRISLAGSEVDRVAALARMRHEAGSLVTWLLGDELAPASAAGGMPAPALQAVRQESTPIAAAPLVDKVVAPAAPKPPVQEPVAASPFVRVGLVQAPAVAPPPPPGKPLVADPSRAVSAPPVPF